MCACAGVLARASQRRREGDTRVSMQHSSSRTAVVTATSMDSRDVSQLSTVAEVAVCAPEVCLMCA